MIETIDHTKIKPLEQSVGADVIVAQSWEDLGKVRKVRTDIPVVCGQAKKTCLSTMSKSFQI